MSETGAVENTGSDVVESVEADAEGGSQTPDAAAAAESTPAPQPNKKKFKLKVDGEEVEEEIDLNNEDDLRSRLQLARAAKKRMADAQAEKKKAYEIIKAFESDPKTMLARLGPKGREIAEEFLVNKIKEDMLTPEQKQQRERDEKLSRYEREEKEREERAARDKAEHEERAYAETFQKTIISALDKSGMPKSAANVKRLAFLMSKNLELGLELSPEELAAEWKQERAQEYSADIKDMTAEQFIALFGDGMAKKLQQHAIRQLQEKQGQVFQGGKKQASEPAAAPMPKRPMTMDEWRAEIERRARD